MKTLADFDLPHEFETLGGYKATVCGINYACLPNQVCGFLEDGEGVTVEDWNLNGGYMRDGTESNFDIIIPQGDSNE